jgi:hypothetical protein
LASSSSKESNVTMCVMSDLSSTGIN